MLVPSQHLQEGNGSDSLAVQLVDEEHWSDLVIIIAVVCTYDLVIVIAFSAVIYLSFLKYKQP